MRVRQVDRQTDRQIEKVQTEADRQKDGEKSTKERRDHPVVSRSGILFHTDALSWCNTAADERLVVAGNLRVEYIFHAATWASGLPQALFLL